MKTELDETVQRGSYADSDDGLAAYLCQISQFGKLLTFTQEVDLSRRIKAGTVYSVFPALRGFSATRENGNIVFYGYPIHKKKVDSLASRADRKGNVETYEVDGARAAITVTKGSAIVLEENQVRTYVKLRTPDAAEAAEELSNHNLKLVVPIAKHYFRDGRMALIDIIQEGNFGLQDAVDIYDYRRGLRFSTNATWRIRARISRALRKSDGVISLDALAEDVGCSVGELLPDKKAPDPIHEPGRLEISEEVEYLLSQAESVRDRKILEERFLRGWKLERLGNVLGICKERVRQLQNIAIATIREKVGVEV